VHELRPPENESIAYIRKQKVDAEQGRVKVYFRILTKNFPLYGGNAPLSKKF